MPPVSRKVEVMVMMTWVDWPSAAVVATVDVCTNVVDWGAEDAVTTLVVSCAVVCGGGAFSEVCDVGAAEDSGGGGALDVGGGAAADVVSAGG